MDHPNLIMTLKTDSAGLTAARAQKLTSAITTVEHCLRPWQPFITAATTHPLHITVTTTRDSGPTTAPTVGAQLDTDQAKLRLQVPNSLLQEPPNRLATRILDVVVPALVTHAEHRPHPQPPTFWERMEERLPPADDQDPGILLEDLLDGDVLLIARHDGTPTDADSRERTLDDYLGERLETPGVAAIDGAFTTKTVVVWTLELL
jgi:hypothetical protein